MIEDSQSSTIYSPETVGGRRRGSKRGTRKGRGRRHRSRGGSCQLQGSPLTGGRHKRTGKRRTGKRRTGKRRTGRKSYVWGGGLAEEDKIEEL